MSKHTQEEWQIAGENQDFVYAIGPNGGNKFWAAVSSAGSDRISDEEKAANARLIAAAPDLLEALQRVMAQNVPLTGNPTHAQQVEFWQDEKAEGRGDADDMLAALAAIAKATGESL